MNRAEYVAALKTEREVRIARGRSTDDVDAELAQYGETPEDGVQRAVKGPAQKRA